MHFQIAATTSPDGKTQGPSPAQISPLTTPNRFASTPSGANERYITKAIASVSRSSGSGWKAAIAEMTFCDFRERTETKAACFVERDAAREREWFFLQTSAVSLEVNLFTRVAVRNILICFISPCNYELCFGIKRGRRTTIPIATDVPSLNQSLVPLQMAS